MAVPLYLTTLITSIIFLPISVIMYYMEKKNNLIFPFFIGGSAWSLISTIQFVIFNLVNIILPRFTLDNSSSISVFKEVIQNHRALLFWLFVFLVLIGETIRYLGTTSEGLVSFNIRDLGIFGFGWGIGEFITRFLFFFNESQILYTLYLGVFVISLNIGLSMMMIRSETNTKYVMFASFIRFFIELGMFGAFGFDNDLNTAFLSLFGIFFFGICLIYIAIITRDYEFDE